MTRFRRRLWFGAALVVLVLLGAGGWFYHAFYGSTDAATRYAEAFNFRRLQVARVDEQGTYRFFYATNRRAESGDAALEERFGNEREEGLRFGLFDTAIEPTLGLGMIIDRTKWFQNEAIKLRSVEKLDRPTFVEEVRRRVQDSPHRSLLVVVHGFREAFPSALRKTAFLSHVLDARAGWPRSRGRSWPKPWS